MIQKLTYLTYVYFVKASFMSLWANILEAIMENMIVFLLSSLMVILKFF